MFPYWWWWWWGCSFVLFCFATEMMNTIMGALCHDTHGLVPAYAVHQPGKLQIISTELLLAYLSVMCCSFFVVCEIIRSFHFRHQIHEKKTFHFNTLLNNWNIDRKKMFLFSFVFFFGEKNEKRKKMKCRNSFIRTFDFWSVLFYFSIYLQPWNVAKSTLGLHETVRNRFFVFGFWFLFRLFLLSLYLHPHMISSPFHSFFIRTLKHIIKPYNMHSQ